MTYKDYPYVNLQNEGSENKIFQRKAKLNNIFYGFEVAKSRDALPNNSYNALTFNIDSVQLEATGSESRPYAVEVVRAEKIGWSYKDEHLYGSKFDILYDRDFWNIAHLKYSGYGFEGHVSIQNAVSSQHVIFDVLACILTKVAGASARMYFYGSASGSSREVFLTLPFVSRFASFGYNEKIGARNHIYLHQYCKTFCYLEETQWTERLNQRQNWYFYTE